MPDTELLLKSEPVRRVEVFTGAGRRRTWTAEEKVGIVAESYAAGETVSAVARRHGLTPQQLFGWRRAAGRPLAIGMGEHGPAFAPVIVEGAPSRASVVPPSHGSRMPAIEIVIGATTVRVPPGADVATLQAVLCAVKAMS
jgi:transposase